MWKEKIKIPSSKLFLLRQCWPVESMHSADYLSVPSVFHSIDQKSFCSVVYFCSSVQSIFSLMWDFLTTLLCGSIETGGQPELVCSLSHGGIPGRDVCFLSLSYQDKTWGPRYETIDFTTLANPIYSIYFRLKHSTSLWHLTVLQKR